MFFYKLFPNYSQSWIKEKMEVGLLLKFKIIL